MKKIFLLLVLFNSLIFSSANGFLDLKWGASKDETLKYMEKDPIYRKYHHDLLQM